MYAEEYDEGSYFFIREALSQKSWEVMLECINNKNNKINKVFKVLREKCGHISIINIFVFFFVCVCVWNIFLSILELKSKTAKGLFLYFHVFNL